MGFADYLSRNPSGKPALENQDDKKFVKNTKQKNLPLRHNIEPTEVIKLTGNYNQSNDSKQNIEMTSQTLNKKRSRKITLFALIHSITSRFM